MYSADTSGRVVLIAIGTVHLCEHASTAGFDSLDLSLRPRHALETRGKLRAVEVEALACLNRTEGRAGSAANAARVVPGLVQRAMLLCLLAVAGERLGERVSWGGWVGLRGVVDVCTRWLAMTLDTKHWHHVRDGVVRLPRKRIMGWRPAWRILVAFIVRWMRCSWYKPRSAVADVQT